MYPIMSSESVGGLGRNGIDGDMAGAAAAASPSAIRREERDTTGAERTAAPQMEERVRDAGRTPTASPETKAVQTMVKKEGRRVGWGGVGDGEGGKLEKDERQ